MHKHDHYIIFSRISHRTLFENIKFHFTTPGLGASAVSSSQLLGVPGTIRTKPHSAKCENFSQAKKKTLQIRSHCGNHSQDFSIRLAILYLFNHGHSATLATVALVVHYPFNEKRYGRYPQISYSTTFAPAYRIIPYLWCPFAINIGSEEWLSTFSSLPSIPPS
jgi:hypothetical protein